MIHTDGRPTIANTPLEKIRRRHGRARLAEQLVEVARLAQEDRVLIDASELARRLAAARAEGYTEGYQQGRADEFSLVVC